MLKIASPLLTVASRRSSVSSFSLGGWLRSQSLPTWLRSRLPAALCRATSEILFLRGIIPGALLLAAMALQPGVLGMGLAGLLAAVAFAHLTQLGQDYLNQSPFLYNPLLAGLSVGYLFRFSPAALFLAAAAGILAFLFTWTLAHILRTFFYLPVLSLPFILVSWIVHLAGFRYAGLEAAQIPAYAYTIGWPLPIEGFLRTLGLIFFLPNVWVGMVVMALLLVNSRIQFLLAVAGYALGTTARGLLTGTFDYVYYDTAALNFILVALAIGGFYLLPSPRSYTLAGIGVTLSALVGEAIAVFWTAVALPVHALPYNLVTMLMLYILGLAGNRLLVRYPQSSPEKTLDQELTARLRYQGCDRRISLPFAGRWLVWQGVDGTWTHKGLWRHAYDFLIRDEAGSSYRGAGLHLSNYYAFQKPVLSPIRGWVAQVVADLPDNAIGQVDQQNNWGNYVVLYDERGFYVTLAHFAQHSISLKAGDRVERGTLLGRCGNSGYSPQPHIHVQAQLSADPRAATVPFCFSNVLANDGFQADCTPTENTWLENVPSQATDTALANFPLETHLHFAAFQRGRQQGELKLTVRMATDGCFYFDSGNAKLFFSRDDNRFMFHRLEGHDPMLALLWVAMPRLPLMQSIGHTWQDYLPAGTVTQGWRRLAYQFASSFLPQLATARYAAQWLSPVQLAGSIAIPGCRDKHPVSVTFSADQQLLSLQVGSWQLLRQDRNLVAPMQECCKLSAT